MIMKKKNIVITAMVIALTITMSLNLQAQTKVWSVGPEVGISLSKYGKDAGTNDYKTGAIGGMFLTYSILNTFGITTKLLYYQKGASFESSDTKQTLNYIEVPILGRFFLNKEGTIRPNIFVGPSFGFLTGATNKVGSSDRVDIDGYKDIYNTFDFGVTGGLGVNFLISRETYFIIDARYTHGLSDLSVANGDVNNNSFGLTAGLSFGF
jgi:outer membrane protein W